MSTRLRVLVASPVSLVFLWFAFRNLDAHALWSSLTSIHLPWVGLYLVALAGTQVARAARWQILTEPFAKLPAKEVWRISNVGNMLIMLLPLRLGELSRPYLTKQAAGSSLSEGLGAAVVERVLDGLLVTLLFFATTWALDGKTAMPPALMAGAHVALLIFVSASAVLATALVTHGKLQQLMHRFIVPRIPTLGSRVVDIIDGFVTGLRSLPSYKAVVGVLLWTLFYWGINAWGMTWLMHAFGWQLSWLAGCTTVCVLVVGVMIPAGPGLLGTYQAAIMAALTAFGIGKNEAAAYSVVAYLGNLLVVVGFGLPHLWHRPEGEVTACLAAGEGEASE